jgi:hypothetical protein
MHFPSAPLTPSCGRAWRPRAPEPSALSPLPTPGNGPTPVMRTSQRWIHRCHGFSQVTIRPQLSCHVALGFSRHVVTVSVITFSYDIETGRSWMCWKGDDDAVVLDLVPAPEDSWIILCDHGKVLRHLFGPTWPCIVSGLKSKLWAPNPWPSSTLGRVLDYKHSRRRY